MKALQQQEYYNYEDLIESMEVEVIANEDDGTWSGDSFYLVRDGEHVGFLTFGWGSCSYCDALEGCQENLEEVTELRDQLFSQIKWWDSAKAALHYFLRHDWEVEWYGRNEGFETFKSEVIKLLGNEVVKPLHPCEVCLAWIPIEMAKCADH